MNGTVPGSKPYRDRLRAELAEAGVTGACLTEQVAADLARQGMRPRRAWRYASELSQRVVAMRFNEVTGDPRAPMMGNRIWDFERWPDGGVRPTARTLTILARVYGTTWDLLVDAADLARMPQADREAYAEAATNRARAADAGAPPPAEEIHIWMATVDRITRHVVIPRQTATMPLLMSVFHGMIGRTRPRSAGPGDPVRPDLTPPDSPWLAPAGDTRSPAAPPLTETCWTSCSAVPTDSRSPPGRRNTPSRSRSMKT